MDPYPLPVKPLPRENTLYRAIKRRSILKYDLLDVAISSSAILEPPGQQVVAFLGLDRVVPRSNRDMCHLVHALPLTFLVVD